MFILIQFLVAGIAGAATSPSVYDQRQTGKTNVRVEVKDAIIIAIGDGELGGDYDYSYDYSDLTIKPPQPSISTSTKAPTTSTAAPTKLTTIPPPKQTPPAGSSNGSQNALILEAQNNSIIFPAVKPGNGSAEPVKIPSVNRPDKIPVIVLQEILGNSPYKFLPVKTVEKEYVSSSEIRRHTTPINPETLPIRHCSPGFFLDNHNRCKRIVRPLRDRPNSPAGFRNDQKSTKRS